MKKWIALLLGLVLAAAGICLFLSRTWMWADVPRVVAGTLSTGSVTKRFSLNAELEAEAGVDVVPDERLDASLIVQEVCVRVGDAVEAGQTLGTLTITSGGQTIAERDLIAPEPVGALRWGDVYLQMLRALCMG